MNSEVSRQIDVLVRGGFVPASEIADMVIESFDSEELDADEVQGHTKAALRALRRQAASWPAVTDCEKLDAVFRALGDRHLIAIQNAGYTQSDGYSDVGEVLRSHPQRSEVIGYCFFHGQDLERAVNGDGLYLAFGPIDPKLEQTVGAQVGRLIVEELGRAGLEATWDGTFAQRIFLPHVDWKRRRVDW